MNAKATSAQSSQSGPTGGGGSGSSIPGWLKITGIGCAVVLLVGGLLLGLGVFRTATCCTEYGEFAERINQVQQESHGFATDLHTGDYEVAYQMLGSETRDEYSLEEFRNSFADRRDFLDANEPFPALIDYDDIEEFDLFNPGDVDLWTVQTHFGEPQFEELLQLRLFIKAPRADDEGLIDIEIIDWELDVIEEDYRYHRFSESAKDFHRRLMNGQLTEAQRMMSMDSELRMVSDEDFAAEMGPTAERLSEMTDHRVHGLFPQGAYAVAVRMLLGDREGKAHLVDYYVDWEGNPIGVSEVQPAPQLDDLLARGDGDEKAPKVDDQEETDVDEADEEGEQGEDPAE